MRITGFPADQLALNLVLLPKGIDNKGTACRFSLILGLISLSTDANPKEVDPLLVLEGIWDLLLSQGSQLKWTPLDQSLQPFFSSTDLQRISEDKKTYLQRWQYLLGGEKKQYHLHSKMQTDQRSKQAIYDNKVLNRTSQPYHPLNVLISNSKEQLTAANFGPHVVSQLKACGDLIHQQNQIYDQIQAEGRRQSGAMSKHVATTAQVDVVKLVNGLHLHPLMAEYYGISIELLIPLGDVRLGQPGSYFTDTLLAFPMKLYTPQTAPFYNSLDSLDPTDALPGYWLQSKFFAGTRNHNQRYYHGSAGYGLVDNKDVTGDTGISVQFTTMAPDHKLQNEYQSNQAHVTASKTGRRLIDYSDHKQQATQGIYMMQIPAADNSIQDGSPNSKLLLGKCVAVKVSDPNNPTADDPVYSLGYREVIYDINFNKEKRHQYEEGWLHTNAAVNGLTETYQLQTIFQWTGQNLCVERQSVPQQDQPKGAGGTDGNGGVAGQYGDGESDLLQTRGFTVSHALVEGRDVFLTAKKGYSFLLRDVLNNGFTIPLDHRCTDNVYEMTLADLDAQTALANQWFPFCEGKGNAITFLLDNDPVNPPFLMADKIFRQVRSTLNKAEVTTHKSDTPESVVHIVVKKGQRENRRYFYPPMINFQFACLLGLLTPETLEAKSAGDYLLKAIDLLERASRRTIEGKPGPMNYLSDTRGRSILITPADWYTKSVYPWGYRYLKDFYPYQLTGDIYKGIDSGTIVARATEGGPGAWISGPVAGKEITIDVGAAQELNFNMQFFDDQVSVIPSHLQGSKQVNPIINNLLPPVELYQPAFPQAGFQLMHPVELPGEGLCPDPAPDPAKPITVQRIDHSGNTEQDQTKVYFPIAFKGLQLEAMKNLEMASTYTIMKDDGVYLPDEHQVREISRKWKETNPTKVLLVEEYPSDIFLHTETNLPEPEVFKTGFGINFNWPAAFLNGLLPGQILWSLTINAANSLQCQVGNDTIGKAIPVLYYSQTSGSFNPVVGSVLSMDNPYQIRLQFSFSTNQLQCSLLINEVSIPLPAPAGTPFPDMSRKYLSLSPDIEKRLLASGIDNPSQIRDTRPIPATDPTFSFLDTSSFFVYRNEVTPQYILKSLVAKAINRFNAYFPGKSQDQLMLQSTPIEVLIPSNQIPAKPVFQLTPLIVRTWDEKEPAGLTKKRCMQLMIEIDRPFLNGEKFALILGTVTSDTGGANVPVTLNEDSCAIGRDMTTIGDAIPKSLGDVLLQSSKDYPYLEKYRYTEDENPVVTVTGTNDQNPGPLFYQLRTLEPYFELQKRKWVVVLGIDEEVAAYNPFVKIVACKYHPKATTSCRVSGFTAAKYINLLSKRQISIKIIREHLHFWQITIDNFTQQKVILTDTPGSIFVVALRHQNSGNVLGALAPSTVILRNGGGYAEDVSASGTALFHPLPSQEFYLKHHHRRTLCLYEFENFLSKEDLAKLDPKGDWLSEPGLRLIYAEEFN